MNNLRALALTSWFIPLVVLSMLIDFSLGLYIGAKIGFAKGQQVQESQK